MLIEFYNDRSRRDGLTRECRACDAERHRKRWRAIPEKMRAKSRQRYQRNNTAENRERNAQRRRSDRGKAINLAAVKRYQDRNQEKRAAHAAVSKAIRAGILERPEQCELAHLGGCTGRIEMHHENYDRPLDVRALCTEHHNARHHKPRHYDSEGSLFEIEGQSKGEQTPVSARLVSDEVSHGRWPMKHRGASLQGYGPAPEQQVPLSQTL